MKKLNEVELMDMLDKNKTAATTDKNALHADDLAALNDAELAMMALQAWEEAEPIQASEDFWPKLREKLPERPPRSAWQRATGVLGAWLWPAHAPLAASMRVAMLAVILALASFWFAPQRAVTPLSADNFTPEETAFIERSLQRHDNYITVGPSDGSLGIPLGDASSAENNQSEPSAEYIP